MNKWCLLLVVVCFALLGQDRSWIQDRGAEYHLVPYDSIGARVPFRIVSGAAIEKRGTTGIRHKALIQTRVLTIAADEMEWNHETGEIKLSGNVLVKLPADSKLALPISR
jgi:hypothetical protein